MSWWSLRVSSEHWASHPLQPHSEGQFYLFARGLSNLALAWRMVYSYQVLCAWVSVLTQHIHSPLNYTGIACAHSISVALTAWHML